MSTLSDHKQLALNNSAQLVYSGLAEFSNILDETDGKMSVKATVSLSKLQDSIIDFYILCDRYKNTHYTVHWNGKESALNVAVMLITDIIYNFQQHSEYKFVKLFQWLSNNSNITN